MAKTQEVEFVDIGDDWEITVQKRMMILGVAHVHRPKGQDNIEIQAIRSVRTIDRESALIYSCTVCGQEITLDRVITGLQESGKWDETIQEEQE
jgi:hypothetical protein